MCGILGLTHHNVTKAINDCGQMMEFIKHRGPDGQKIYSNDDIVLGHVRLSLVDLVSGDQPMHFESLSIVFNGEIYNHNELREELIKYGYEFLTTSDTEVVLKLFHYYGPSFVEHLNGIFAICIYSSETKKLIFARDFFGIKPLYYSLVDSEIVFASEYKTILKYFRLNNIEYIFNNKALSEFLIKGYISENKLVEETNEIDAGCVVEFSNGKMQKLFQLKSQVQKANQNKIEEALTSQIYAELQADVDIGVLLSGGVDSSLLTALASKRLSNIKTYSIGYQESSTYDESKYARIVANQFKCEHHEFLFTEKELLDQVPSLIACLDQPIYDVAMLPMLYLAENVKKDVKAVLSGDGGDELFGGYIQYRIIKYQKLMRLILFFEPLLKFVFPKVKLLHKLLTNIGMSQGPFFENQNLLTNKPEIRFRSFNDFKEIMKFDVENELKYKLLVKTDLTSMYKGLEIRVPFLNLELYNYSLSLKAKDLIDFFKGKVILRKILAKYLPPIIVNKRKVGFRVPIREWLLKENLRKEVHNNLESNYLIPNDVIKFETAVLLLKKNSKESDFSNQIFSLYILNKWIELNKFKNEHIAN